MEDFTPKGTVRGAGMAVRAENAHTWKGGEHGSVGVCKRTGTGCLGMTVRVERGWDREEEHKSYC